MHKSSKKLAIYTDKFLTPSMTFIYRQISLLPNDWQTFVMTRSWENHELFPYKNVYSYNHTFKERLINKVYRIIGYRYTSLGKKSTNYFISIIKKEKPILIHAHFGTSALEILPIAKQLNIPMITTFHGFDASSLLNNKCYLNQLKELFSYSDILTVSNIMRKQIISLGSGINNTKCIYIGIPIEKFKYIDRIPIAIKHKNGEKITFLQISNFVEKKGHQYTLLAFSELLKTRSNATLILVGNGPLRERMINFASELKIQQSVKFIKHTNTDNVINLMNNADCFLHHSVTASNGDKEGIPTVLMEAMSTGLPVISTNHAGIPELIQPNINGYLVEERDIKNYVIALESIYEDNGSIGRNARLTIEKDFNMDVQIQSLINKYAEILNEKRINN